MLPPETDGLTITGVPSISKTFSISSLSCMAFHLAEGTPALSKACFMGILEVVIW